VVVLAAGVIVAAVLSTRGGSHPDVSPVTTVQPFSLAPVIPGQPPAVLGADPGHPVVLTFFASWCLPCTEELPLIERLSQKWAAAPVGASVPRVVGIDELDQRPDGPDMVTQAGVTFPAGYDHDGSVGAKWDVDGLPITVFIAADGRIVDYHRGQLHQGQLDALVARLEAAGR
jgi:cytochrome c biogenesis protein CcmG/thiol:disulfide interchange protein DsbE